METSFFKDLTKKPENFKRDFSKIKGLNKRSSLLKENVTPQNSAFLKGEDYCQKAKELLKKKQFRSAQNILQKGLMEVEKTAEAYHLLGLALFHQGFFKASLKQFQKATEKEAHPEYLLNLSILLNELGYYEPARKVYEKALKIKEQTAEETWKEELMEKHNQTAKLYLRKNNLKSALNEYIKGAKLCPKPEVKLKIAELLWKLHQKSTAEKYLKSFIYLYPQNIQARLLKAEWHFESQKILLAINEWENVLKIQPQNQTAMNCLLKAQNIKEL